MRWGRGAQRSTKAEDGASSFVVSDDEEESGGDHRLLELGYVPGGVCSVQKSCRDGMLGPSYAPQHGGDVDVHQAAIVSNVNLITKASPVYGAGVPDPDHVPARSDAELGLSEDAEFVGEILSATCFVKYTECTGETSNAMLDLSVAGLGTVQGTSTVDLVVWLHSGSTRLRQHLRSSWLNAGACLHPGPCRPVHGCHASETSRSWNETSRSWDFCNLVGGTRNIGVPPLLWCGQWTWSCSDSVPCM